MACGYIKFVSNKYLQLVDDHGKSLSYMYIVF